MNSTVKTGLQVGLVILAGGALMLSGGVAMAMPSAAPPAAHAECSVVQLPGMDVQLGEPGACVSVLLPPGSARNPTTHEPTSPVAATTAPVPVGDASLPYPCLDVNLPGIRISIGDASPPTQCVTAPTV